MGTVVGAFAANLGVWHPLYWSIVLEAVAYGIDELDAVRTLKRVKRKWNAMVSLTRVQPPA